MFAKLRSHLLSNVVGYVALFVALGGTGAYALSGSNTVFSDDITNGQVKDPDIHADAVGPGKVKGLTGEDLKPNSVGGQRIVESSLGTVPNAAKLGGRAADEYARPCAPGKGALWGLARIIASGDFSNEFTTLGIEAPYNCSGGTVEARRMPSSGGGVIYEVRFNANGAGFALANGLSANSTSFSTTYGVSRVAAGTFRVQLSESNEKPFVILLF